MKEKEDEEIGRLSVKFGTAEHCKEISKATREKTDYLMRKQWFCRHMTSRQQ